MRHSFAIFIPNYKCLFFNIQNNDVQIFFIKKSLFNIGQLKYLKAIFKSFLFLQNNFKEHLNLSFFLINKNDIKSNDNIKCGDFHVPLQIHI